MDEAPWYNGPMERVIRVGTRGSALATTQTQWVVDRLRARHSGLRVETLLVKTLADRVQDVPLSGFRERGVFVKELENALLSGEVDFAVHSMKDLPSDLPPALVVAAVPEREDPRDALIVRDPLPAAPSGSLPLREGAVVGSSSLRRQAQLLFLRPDLRIIDLRGNVDTRLRKLDEGQYDAIVLAAAGLSRLGLAGRISMLLPDEIFLPAVSQGALAIECRADDAEVLRLLSVLECAETRTCVRAERALLAALEGGCAVPVGALVRIEGAALVLHGMIARPDGTLLLREVDAGTLEDPEALGTQVGERLLAAGGRAILDALAASRGV